MRYLLITGLVGLALAKSIGYIVYEDEPKVYPNTPKVRTAIGIYKWMNTQKYKRWKHQQKVFRNAYIHCVNSHKFCVQKHTKFKPYKFEKVLKMLNGVEK